MQGQSSQDRSRAQAPGLAAAQVFDRIIKTKQGAIYLINTSNQQIPFNKSQWSSALKSSLQKILKDKVKEYGKAVEIDPPLSCYTANGVWGTEKEGRDAREASRARRAAAVAAAQAAQAIPTPSGSGSTATGMEVSQGFGTYQGGCVIWCDKPQHPLVFYQLQIPPGVARQVQQMFPPGGAGVQVTLNEGQPDAQGRRQATLTWMYTADRSPTEADLHRIGPVLITEAGQMILLKGSPDGHGRTIGQMTNFETRRVPRQ